MAFGTLHSSHWLPPPEGEKKKNRAPSEASGPVLATASLPLCLSDRSCFLFRQRSGSGALRTEDQALIGSLPALGPCHRPDAGAGCCGCQRRGVRRKVSAFGAPTFFPGGPRLSGPPLTPCRPSVTGPGHKALNAPCQLWAIIVVTREAEVTVSEMGCSFFDEKDLKELLL